MKMKRSLLSILISIFISSTCFAQWVSLDKFSNSGAKPRVEIISSDMNSTTIKVDLPGYWLSQFQFEGKTYNSISIGEDAVLTNVGLPEIPYVAKILAIPDNGTVDVEVIKTSSINTLEGIVIPPARESWIEGKPETPYLENQKFYSEEKIYPKELVRVEDPVIFRDFRLARISIFPIRYSPVKKQVEALSSITIKVNYKFGAGINPKLSPKRTIAKSFHQLYKGFIFNYEEVLQNRYGGRTDGQDIMLCIMPDEFVNSFQPYAEWKTKTGTQILIKKFSEINATASNPTPIKNYILSVYESGIDVPTHILIIGDYGIAPVKYVNYDWTFVNEDFFVELEGNDHFPEMMIGRFTNQGDYRLQVMVNKYLTYEKYPSTSDNDWYKKGTVCSNDAYTSQIETKRFTAERMLTDGKFISVDTMMSNYNCTYELDDVIAAINSGRSFLNYRGEGWTSGWWASCYPFQTEDVNSLNNGSKLTFVTSIGCGVAQFDVSGADNCFGEAWIELGSLTQPRGGCAFIGPTSNTHTTYNNKIDKGIYVGMFQEGMDSPGQALLRGKLYLYNVYGNDPWVEYHYRIYCILGDPSLHVWKDIPRPVTVTYPPDIYVGFNQVPVTVVDSISGLPVSNARICLSGNDVYVTGITDENGIATLEITPASSGNISIVVTGGNVVPKEGTIEALMGTENITPQGNPLIVDLDGNTDGLINPNENCSITFSVKNWGSILSENVFAKLSLPDTIFNVQITTDSIFLGNISPGDSIKGSAFQFFINPEFPIGSIIPFKLHISSSSSSWNYTHNEIVHGCNLNYEEYHVDDSGNLLHNFRMDPGETVKIKIKISNIGDDEAPNIIAKIKSNDPYMTITDSLGSFGTLLADSSVINSPDDFTIAVSEDCPSKHEAKFLLELTTQNGYYPYSRIDTIRLSVAMPSALDPTGADSYGYYAYANADTLWNQAPQFEWIEINNNGTLIPKPPEANDFTQTVTLPFTFKYYGNDFVQLRISSDGWIAFGNGVQTAFQNYPLPQDDEINNMVAVFWENLYSDQSQTAGKLYYYADTDNHRFIIEWFEVPHFSDISDIETFQIILLDPAYYSTPTGDGEIIFQYKQVEEAGSCTIGLENDTENIGLLYLFDEQYDSTANEILNNSAIKFTTNSPVIVSVEEEMTENLLPTIYSLEQNYPNPFNPSTTIKFKIADHNFVSLKVYDLLGEEVAILVNEELSAGEYRVEFNPASGILDLASGIYFYQLNAGSFIETKKMILIK